MARRIRPLVRLVVLLILEVSFLAVLYWSGRFIGSVPLTHLGAWLRQPSSERTVTSLIRLVALVFGWWLLASTLLYLTETAIGVLGGGRRWPGASKWLALPAVRRVIDGVVGVTMLASTIGAGASVASAAPIHPTAIVRPLRQPRRQPPARRSTGASSLRTGSKVVEESAPVRRHLPHPATVIHTAPVLKPASPQPDAPSPANGFAGLLAGTKVHVVVPGDCLSVIAQRYLGDWRLDAQIFELNAGHLQPDGHVLTDAHWIYPGWILVLPDTAVGATTVQPAASPTPAPKLRSGDLPVAGRQAAVGTAGQPAGPAPTSATSSVPLPPSAAPAVAGMPRNSEGQSATTAPKTTTAVAEPAPSPTRRVHHVSGNVEGRSRLPGWLVPSGAGGGATLLATWALVEAARRRGRRLRSSRAGFVMPPTDPTIAPVAAAVRAVSDVAVVDRLQAALYHLGTIGDRELRPVVMLAHPDGRIDVQLATPADPVDPWTATDRRFWTLDPAAELPDSDPVVTPCPALVQLGLCEDGAELYLDLEAVGLLGLAGTTAETVRQVARALTATLVVSPTTRLCRVLTLGFDPFGLDDQVEDRLVVASSVESLLHEAEMTARDVERGIDDVNCGSSFRLRAMDADSGWEPAVVVIAGTVLAGDEIARLEGLAGGGGRGAAVVCSGVDATWTLELVDPVGGWWQLNPLGQKLRPVQMAGEELREVAAYLADADTEPVEAPAEAPRPASAGDVDPSSPAGAGSGTPIDAPSYLEPEWVVMVRLFGPPSVVNRHGVVSGDLGRGAPLELLAWLVTHRDTATRAGAKDALWCGEEVSARTVTNALYGARSLLRSLADEPDDEFIAGPNGRLLLNRRVVSDYELVAHRLTYARRHMKEHPATVTEVLADGLGHLRGIPLAGVEWLWADENHLSSNLAMLGSALATELANLRLQAGQTDAAIQATIAGLEIIPGNEELIRLRMQACIDAGDRRAALSVYEKYEGVAVARGESVSPTIAELRNGLLRSASRRS